MSVKKGDKQLFSLDKLHVELTPSVDGKPMEFTGAAEKFSADLTETEDPQSKAVIEALGYQHDQRLLRDGRLLAADRRAHRRSRSTTSRSRMPARSA